MSGPLRILILLLLACAAVALAACGGEDDRDAKNAYVGQVNAAQKKFAQTVTTVSKRSADNRSSSQARKTLEKFQTAIGDIVTDLRDIEVPGAVQSEHAQLVEAMSGFDTDIRGAVSALRNPTEQNIKDARSTIATAMQTVNLRIDAAIAAINSKLGQ